MERILLIQEDKYIEFPKVEGRFYEDLSLVLDGESTILIDDDVELKLASGKKMPCSKGEILWLSECSTCYEVDKPFLLIGKQHADIQMDLSGGLVLENKTIINEDQFPIYINGSKTKRMQQTFQYGDQILVGNVLLIVQKETVHLYGAQDSYQCKLRTYRNQQNHIEDFPYYKRSPRLIKRIKDDRITILKPPTPVVRTKGSLAKVILPPLGMAGVSVMSAMIMGRGLFVLVAIAGTIVTLVVSLTTFFSDKKDLKKKNIKRVHVYENYLLETTKKLETYKQDELEAYQYNFPDLHEIQSMITTYNSRIYERDMVEDDFLCIKVGSSRDDSEYKVSLDYDALELEKDDLMEEAKRLFNDYQFLEHKPMLVDLKQAHLGLVGEEKDIHNQIKSILAQLTFFQSYYDVEIIMLYNEMYKSEFDYIRWYPHVKLHNVNLTGNINSERVRDQVLGSLNQILKDRKLKFEEHKKERRFLPHYVLFIDDYTLVTNHAIMGYLQENSTDLGFTLIYSAQKRANLPENIKTVLLVEDSRRATLLMKEGKEVNKRLLMESIESLDFEYMARSIASLIHVQGVASYIPESVSYFDMYKVDTPEQLNILQRWSQGESHKSLAVPLGMRSKDDVVQLNLHEKAHGPHGLVAGTTGSGKSEIVQSYILSLATNFSPYEVGFLLIDYKGGGMANLFKKLPHLLGTITNLDGAESMRALASIKAELARRQRVFNTYEVNNINKYNQLFKQGKAKEPLPHLFIISDEFAELKKEQPEFMSELVSVARIGRTLGVHLILATQKPTGVVDDQIWSNSKFKLALKVQNESDSKEILKTPDASFITLPGRAYLQVGNNEIYELFQSAWSGAAYSKETVESKVDDRVYQINALGQIELINKDLSDVEDNNQNEISQLDAVVGHISDLYEAMKHEEVTKPWLPTLTTNIHSPYVKVTSKLHELRNIDLDVAIGLMDIPEQQTQKNYHVNLQKDGNLAIFASSGFGKTMTLGTILSTLAVKNNPELLQYYILDFGNSAMMPYKDMPHTADYMNFDSVEKLNKFKLLMEAEMKERKLAFGHAMAQNFEMYNTLNQEKLMHAIVIVIDNFDVVKEVSNVFEDFLLKLTRDGAGLGIYTIITATRGNAVRFAIMNNFKQKIVQYLFDEGEVMGLVGRSPYKLNEIKGRALVKEKIISVMQVYTPVKFEDDVEYLKAIQALIKELKHHYGGKKLMGIPVLPDVFTSSDYANYTIEGSNSNLIGLSIHDVNLVSAKMGDSPFVVVGPVKCGKTNVLELLMNQNKGVKFLFDSATQDLYKYKLKQGYKYINNEEEINAFVEDVIKEVEKRKQGLEDVLKSNTTISPREYYEQLDPWTIYIDDADIFIEKTKNQTNILKELQSAATVGIRMVATVSSVKFKGYEDYYKYFKDTTYGLVMGTQSNIPGLTVASTKDVPSFGFGVLFENGNQQRIKLAKYDGGFDQNESIN